MSKKNAVETNKMKPLSWAKARRIRGRGGGTDFIRVSLVGNADQVTCTTCNEHETLVDFDADGKDRNAQVTAFTRRHYERHPIMVEVKQKEA